MKKLFIAVLVLNASFLIALAQEGKADPGKKYTPQEAKSQVGKYVTIAGKVAQVHQAEKVTHLNFDKPHPNTPFTAVVFSSRTNLFPDLTKLTGKTVEVTGKVEEYQGKPQIVLVAKTQLKIPDEKSDTKPEPKPEKPETTEPPKTDK